MASLQLNKSALTPIVVIADLTRLVLTIEYALACQPMVHQRTDMIIGRDPELAEPALY
jgi:hypothetical protein